MGGLALEHELDLLCLVLSEGDFLSRDAEFLVPRFDGVIAGGQAIELEDSIFPADREVRVFENGDVTAHPGMHVAFHRNPDFGPRKTDFDVLAWRLRHIKFAIVDRDRMDVVSRRVAI